MKTLNVRLVIILGICLVVLCGGGYAVHYFQNLRNADFYLRRAEQSEKRAEKAEEEGDEEAAREAKSEAIKQLKWYLNLKENDIDAQEKLGLLEADLAFDPDTGMVVGNMFRPAWMVLENVVAQDPTRTTARRRLIDLAMKIGGRRLKDAREHTEELLKKSPKDAELWDLLGQCQQNDRDYDAAARSSSRSSRCSSWSGCNTCASNSLAPTKSWSRSSRRPFKTTRSDPMHPTRLRSIVESLLFASDHPLALKQIRDILAHEHGDQLGPHAAHLSPDPNLELDLADGAEPGARDPVRDAVKELTEAYSDPERSFGRGFTLVEVAGGFQFRTVAENATYVKRLFTKKPTRLTRASVETLSIIAYRQPITRPEVEEIRGVDCGPVLKSLLERRLVKILGKKEEVGRPLVYGTTPEFLQLFQLKTLGNMPTLREFRELSEEHQAQVDAVEDPAAEAGPTLEQLRAAAPQLGVEEGKELSTLEDAIAVATDITRTSGSALDQESQAKAETADPGTP